MKLVKAIRLFYLVYTVYTIMIVLVSDYKPYIAIIGLTIMWLTYILFVLGAKSIPNSPVDISSFDYSVSRSKFPFSDIDNWKVGKYILVFVASWISAILSARYYTGMGFTSVLMNLGKNGTAYMTYQLYFRNSNLGSFSISKIPYVLMLFFLTATMICSLISILILDKNVNFWKYIFLVGVVGAYLYFGVARGTNFETYIVFIMISFCLLQKSSAKNKLKKYKYLILIFIAGVVMIFVFRMRIMSRGVNNLDTYICSEISYNSQSMLAKMFPEFTGILGSFFGYLGYGIYVTGVVVWDLCLKNIFTIFVSLLPVGHKYLLNETLNSAIRNTIDIGVHWVPDFVLFIDAFGFVLYMIIIVLLGRITLKIENGNYDSILKLVVQALVFIEMLSIPVGNFLMSSSSNKLMVLFVLVWLFQSGPIKLTMKLKK